MALAAGRWYTVIELADTGNQRTTMRFEQSAPADAAAALAAGTALATDMAAVSDAVIAKYFVYQVYEEDAFALPAAAQIENQALITLSIDDEPSKVGTIRIPAPTIDIFAGATGPNSNIVDGTDADVIALVANWVSEDLYYVSDGEQAEAFISGHRRHMKKSHG